MLLNEKPSLDYSGNSKISMLESAVVSLSPEADSDIGNISNT